MARAWKEKQSLNCLRISPKELNASSQGVQYRVPGILGQSFGFWHSCQHLPHQWVHLLPLLPKGWIQLTVICLVNKRSVLPKRLCCSPQILTVQAVQLPREWSLICKGLGSSWIPCAGHSRQKSGVGGGKVRSHHSPAHEEGGLGICCLHDQVLHMKRIVFFNSNTK